MRNLPAPDATDTLTVMHMIHEESPMPGDDLCFCIMLSTKKDASPGQGHVLSDICCATGHTHSN